MDDLRASEQRLRDEVFRLEKQLVRAGTLRDKFRATCHELEASNAERDERGQRLAHVDAECDMLAHMVRELRKSSGTDPREFMLAVERAIASHDDAPETSPRGSRTVVAARRRSDIDEGYDTPDEDVDDGARDDARVSFVDDDFPSPPISGIVDDANAGFRREHRVSLLSLRRLHLASDRVGAMRTLLSRSTELARRQFFTPPPLRACRGARAR